MAANLLGGRHFTDTEKSVLIEQAAQKTAIRLPMGSGFSNKHRRPFYISSGYLLFDEISSILTASGADNARQSPAS